MEKKWCSSCFLTGEAGCFHQREPAGGIYGGSGATDCAVAEATSPSNGASSTGKMVADAESEALKRGGIRGLMEFRAMSKKK